MPPISFTADVTAPNIDALTGDVAALQAAQAAGVVGFGTRATMDASLGYPERTVAVVLNDTTPANLGYYRKIGASGTGSWMKATADPLSLLAADVAELEDRQADADLLLGIEARVLLSRPAYTGQWNYTEQLFGPLAVGYLAPAVRSIVSGLTIELSGLQQLGGKLVVRVYHRPEGSTYTGGPSTLQGDETLYAGDFPVSAYAAHDGFQVLAFDLGAVAVPAGGSVLVEVEPRKADNTIGLIGVRYTQPATGYSQLDRGYYWPPSQGAYQGVIDGYAIVATVEGTYAASLLDESAGVAVDPVLGGVVATASATGYVVDVTVQVLRGGSWSTVTATLTLASLGTGARYDLIRLNRQDLTLSAITGTARASDPEEYIPAAGAGQIVLYHAYVGPGTVTLVPVWHYDAQVPMRIGAEGEWTRLRERVRRHLPRTLDRLARGLPVTLVGYGDSITALQSGAPPYNAPDGEFRDRKAYFATSATDTLAALPVFDHGDGAGAVHVHLSYAWVLRDLLAARYPGSVITYRNHGVGGETSAGGLSSTWLNAAIASAPHLVLLEFGMNESGSTATYANVVSLIGSFKAAGAEVLVVGMPRPRPTSGAAAGWTYTHRALESAAETAGAAFLPTEYLQADRALGGLGIPVTRLCYADGNVHPGMREHDRLGWLIAGMMV